MAKYEVSFRNIYNGNSFDFKGFASFDAANEAAKKLRTDGMKDVEIQQIDDVTPAEAQRIIRKRFTS